MAAVARVVVDQLRVGRPPHRCPRRSGIWRAGQGPAGPRESPERCTDARQGAGRPERAVVPLLTAITCAASWRRANERSSSATRSPAARFPDLSTPRTAASSSALTTTRVVLSCRSALTARGPVSRKPELPRRRWLRHLAGHDVPGAEPRLTDVDGLG